MDIYYAGQVDNVLPTQLEDVGLTPAQVTALEANTDVWAALQDLVYNAHGAISNAEVPNLNFDLQAAATSGDWSTVALDIVTNPETAPKNEPRRAGEAETALGFNASTGQPLNASSVDPENLLHFEDHVAAAGFPSTVALTATQAVTVPYLNSQGYYVPETVNATLTGGAGASTFVFAPGDGHDEITNFSTAKGDAIRFDGGVTLNVPLSDLSLTGSNDGHGDLILTVSSSSSTIQTVQVDNFFTTSSAVAVDTNNGMSSPIYQLNLELNGQTAPIAVDANGKLLGNLIFGTNFVVPDGQNAVLVGTGPSNTVDLSHATGNITVDLTAGTITGGDPINDTTINIQNVIGGGTSHDTIKTGTAITFDADAGTINMGAGGTDHVSSIAQIVGNPDVVNTVRISPTDIWSEVSPGHLIVNGIDLENFSAIAATQANETFALDSPSGLTVTGDGTTVVTYAGPVILNENNGQFYDQTGSVHDTLNGAAVSAGQIGSNGQLDMDLPNTAANETLQFAPHFPFDMPEFDYAAFAGAAAFTITVSNAVQTAGADTQIDEQTNAMVQLSNGAVHQGEIEAFTTPLETGLAAAALDLHASGVGGSLEGTNNGDTVTVTSSPEGTGTVSYAPFQFDSGTGNDVANVGASGFVYEYRGGDDTINLTNGTSLGGLMLWGGIEAGDVSVAGLSAGTAVLDVAGYGTITIHGSGGLEALPAITLESGGSLTINTDGTLTASGTADTDVTLTGTWGNDTWKGHDGVNYTFYGEGGNDVLEGGNGNDTLYGGDGNTIFKYGAGGGQDTFIDYSGHDSISIDASLHPADLSYVQSGSDLLIAADWDGSLTNGVADAADTITVKDFYGDPSSISTVGFADGSPDVDLHTITPGGPPGGTHDSWTISDSPPSPRWTTQAG